MGLVWEFSHIALSSSAESQDQIGLEEALTAVQVTVKRQAPGELESAMRAGISA